MSTCFVEKCVDEAEKGQKLHRASWVSGNGAKIGPPFSRSALRLSVVDQIREYNDWPKSRNAKPCPACGKERKFKVCCGKTPERVATENMYDVEQESSQPQTPRLRFNSDGAPGLDGGVPGLS